MVDNREWLPEEVHQKTVRGATSLIVRQAFVTIFNIIGGIFLARLLTTDEFGIYTIITFLLTFLIVLSDLGLGASLIRKNQDPTGKELQAIFTLQQVLILFFVIIFWIVSPEIIKIYSLESNDIWLFRFVSLSIFFTSFQVIPSILLERQLNFKKIAIIEVSQSLVFNSIAILCAFWKLGAMSFVIAIITRSIVGSIIANVISRWNIGYYWNMDIVKENFKFGIMYQGSSYVSLLKDSITPFFIGSLLGTTGVGYINWAQQVSAYPVLVLMVLNRIYLPSFAKLQSQKEELKKLLENTIRATNSFVAPLSIFTIIFIAEITILIFGEKWESAIPIFKLLWFANLVVPTASPFIGYLNGQGRSNVTFIFSLIWMFGTWIFGVPLIIKYGLIGFGIANLLVQFSAFLLFWYVKKDINVSIIKTISPYWILSGIIGVLFVMVKNYIYVKNVYFLALMAILYFLIYFISIFMLFKNKLKGVIKWVKH